MKREAPRSFEWSFESRKYIGVSGMDLSPELAARFGVKDGTGVMIAQLTDGGPAAKAKLLVGDIILSVDGKRVETVNDLIDLVQTKAKGARVKIEVLRDKKTMKFDVEIAEDESGLPLGSGELKSLLESWQGYTDALQREMQNWNGKTPLDSQTLTALTLKGRMRRI
jgi:membrane-associated protease RseP (regulator of RpoE activity)